jgi:hypothetical protein
MSLAKPERRIVTNRNLASVHFTDLYILETSIT